MQYLHSLAHDKLAW